MASGLHIGARAAGCRSEGDVPVPQGNFLDATVPNGADEGQSLGFCIIGSMPAIYCHGAKGGISDGLAQTGRP